MRYVARTVMSNENGRDLVLRFLSSIGRPREFDQYLRLFTAERHRFALIVVSDAVVGDALAALVADIRFLVQLGLFPTLVFGAADPKGAPRRIERVRAALGADVPTTIVGIDEAMSDSNDSAVSLVLLPRSGVEGPGSEDIDARFAALADLAKQREVRKVVFLGRRSGLQPPNGRVVSLIDLPPHSQGSAAHLSDPGKSLTRGEAEVCGISSDHERYRSAFRGHQASLYGQIARMFDLVPHAFTVSVTSPLDLLRELFTVKGAGTLVRRGLPVSRYDSWAAIDSDRVRNLIAEAFGRALRVDFGMEPMHIYVAGDYRGLAVITHTPHGPYLSKFAVPLIARGEGVGGDLWRALTAHLPRLFWRSRSENEINSWYGQIAEGMAKFERGQQLWCGWWRGHSLLDVPALVKFCSQAEDDFAEAPTVRSGSEALGPTRAN